MNLMFLFISPVGSLTTAGDLTWSAKIVLMHVRSQPQATLVHIGDPIWPQDSVYVAGGGLERWDGEAPG